MTIQHPASPDVEQLLTSWIPTVLVDDKARTETPADLDANLPLHRVTRIGGGDLDPTLEQVIVDVDSFGGDRAAASDASRRLKDAMRYQLPGSHFPELGAAVGEVRCTSLPAWRPWDNTNLRRFGATYVLVVHAVPVVQAP